METASFAGVIRLLDGRHRIEDAIAAYEAACAGQEQQRKDAFTSLGVETDAPCPAAVLYHRESSLYHGWSCPLPEDEVVALTRNLQYRRYPDAPRVSLPAAGAITEERVSALVASRRSTHVFSDAEVPLQDVATLLALSCGVTNATVVPPRRATPSAGALYPIEAYVVALAINGLDRAIYHYVALDHALEWLQPFEGRKRLEEVFPPGLWDTTPAVMVVLTSVLPRVQAKYVERGYRFSLLEAGHIGQNLSLVATGLGLHSTCIGGFCDEPLDAMLGLPQGEVALYAFLAGCPPEADSSQPATTEGSTEAWQ